MLEMLNESFSPSFDPSKGKISNETLLMKSLTME